ncbi:MAG: hypothetical protein ACLFQJ_07090 [Campylobacterales bacterium]
MQTQERSREVKTALSLEFQEVDEGSFEIEEEYERLSESDDDPIGHWLRIAKARGETKDSDMLVVNLIVELYRKIDELSEEIKGSKKSFYTLSRSAKVIGLGHRRLLLEKEELEVGQLYYGRINMPVFPRRTIPVFFEAIEPVRGKIVKIHQRDEMDIDRYVTSRERSIIRELKESKWD